MRLTEKQRFALGVLRQSGQRLTPNDLAIVLDTSPEGAAATASSLVRRGLVERVRIAGRVSYKVAPR